MIVPFADSGIYPKILMKIMEPKIVRPETRVDNVAFYCIGLVSLALTKIKNRLMGYRTPRTFSMDEFEKAIWYDSYVVSHWLEFLKLYTDSKVDLEDKVILELGPGADLGVGLILLSKGVLKYNALDIINLVKTVPGEFYEKLFRHLEKSEGKVIEVDFLRKQLELTIEERNDKLNYICAHDFDITRFSGEDVDIVFSQAAFEHFDNIKRTIYQLSLVVKKGGVLVAEVDLKTHTRWLRDVDPLNIYRYSDFTYRLFQYPGQPNRLRPIEYQRILEKNEWENIKIFPLVILDEGYLSRIRDSLYKAFHGPENDMAYLSVMLCATKS